MVPQLEAGVDLFCFTAHESLQSLSVCFYTQQHDVAISSTALFHVAAKYIFIYLISTSYLIG